MQADLSSQKDPDFSSKSHCLISLIPCCLHFPIILNTVNLKALKICLYQSPPVLDRLKYSWLKHQKDIAPKTALLLKLDLL